MTKWQASDDERLPVGAGNDGIKHFPGAVSAAIIYNNDGKTLCKSA